MQDKIDTITLSLNFFSNKACVISMTVFHNISLFHLNKIENNVCNFILL